jgi:hypothetical protein
MLYALPVAFKKAQITVYTVVLDDINRTMHFGPVVANYWTGVSLDLLG